MAAGRRRRRGGQAAAAAVDRAGGLAAGRRRCGRWRSTQHLQSRPVAVPAYVNMIASLAQAETRGFAACHAWFVGGRRRRRRRSAPKLKMCSMLQTPLFKTATDFSQPRCVLPASPNALTGAEWRVLWTRGGDEEALFGGMPRVGKSKISLCIPRRSPPFAILCRFKPAEGRGFEPRMEHEEKAPLA